jgi:hypothetical protein
MNKQQIEVILKRLKYPNEIVSVISNAVHLQTFFDETTDISRIRQFRRIAGKHADITLDLIDALNKPVDVDYIQQKLQELKDTPLKPDISGNDLIKLGIPKGPMMKQVLDAVQDQFEKDPNTPKEEYIKIIKSFL